MVLSVNYLAVLIATILGMLVGALWFSPVLFARQWMALVHRSEKEFKKDQTPTLYLLMFIATLFSAYILALLVNQLHIDTVSGGILLGVMVWLGFIVMSLLPTVLFERKPWKLYLLNIGHELAAIVVMAAVLSVWK